MTFDDDVDTSAWSQGKARPAGDQWPRHRFKARRRRRSRSSLRSKGRTA